MNKVNGKLTIFFEDPFWVGVFESIENETLSVAKVTFGAEPKEHEIMEFMLKHYDRLQFSPTVVTVLKESKRNPKSLQRKVRKQMQKVGIATKSQQALKLQQEQNQLERVQRYQKKKKEDQMRMFELKQQKKRKKHKGH